jgi:hypothetical protein
MFLLKGNQMLDATQPYRVRTSCGHIVIRRMRPSTAGAPFTPETVIEAPNGRPCEDCEVILATDAQIREAVGGASNA